MMSFATRTVPALALVLFSPLALVACGSSSNASGASTAMAATADHGDHAAHEGHEGHEDHAAQENHGGSAMDAMGGDKVDPAGAVKAFDHKPEVGEKAICPVTGDVFVVSDDGLTSEHGGKHYAFCCAACKPRFDANPGAFGG